MKNMGPSHEVSQTVSIMKAECMAVLSSTILSALCREELAQSRLLINIVLNEPIQHTYIICVRMVSTSLLQKRHLWWPLHWLWPDPEAWAKRGQSKLLFTYALSSPQVIYMIYIINRTVLSFLIIQVTPNC